MEDLKDRIACGIVWALIFFFERIPLSWGLRIGDLAGRLVFYFSPRRRVAYINLKAALGEQLSAKERWKAARDHFGHGGQSMVEVMRFRKMTPEHIAKNIVFHGRERLDGVIKSGHGGVFITAHFGNWELLQVVSGLIGTPIHVLARDQKFPRLNELLNKLRESHGSVAISRGAGVRSLIRALRDKKMIGVLGDQSAGKTEGVLLPFFERRTTVPTGAFELAQRTEALILPCFMVRSGGMKHEIHIGEVLSDDPSLEPAARTGFQVRQYLKVLEDFIRRFPNQWLWENKRWKYSWDRKVVILSDGKPGHFKQSEVVAELLKNFKEFHGRPGLEFAVERIPVEYRSEWHRKIFFFLAFLMRPWIQGRLAWLRPFFKEATQKAIEKVSADVIIAAGSGLAPLQMCLAAETGAKKLVIMKPPFPYSLTHYDLAIVPAHDGGKVPSRTFRCVIMPSGYQTYDRSGDVRQLKLKLADEPRAKMAIFIGGATHDYDLTVSDMEKLCTTLKRISSRCGDYMITTSRRTPAHSERFLKSALMQHPACRLLVIANEDNPSYAAGGMMGVADLLIVTEDSLAMSSEAVGTGKRVIVLRMGQGQLPAKHYRFHKILEERGLVTLCGFEDLEKHILDLLKKPAFPVVQRERNALMARLGEFV
ncbi:MAG TPA: ELM1/GtrOC1 family putative glycosyltransferase [Candidatus Omnitrophota bacterium]|nr:ELM1/GtrOC1 family putative glycosyltransferase [Candidatus Omnitrophota bacterium]